MKRVSMYLYDIVGDRAEEAADYINEAERVRWIGADPEIYSQTADYEAEQEAKAKAAEMFGVKIESWF